jgi:hypothetical protein
VSAYWAMMFAGRVVLGPVAERLGPARVLAPSLLVLGLAMGALYAFGSRWSGRAAPPVTPALVETSADRDTSAGGAAAEA